MSLDVVSKLLIGNIPSSLSDVIGYNIDRAIRGELSQFIHGLDAYLKADKEAELYYVERGKKAIKDLISANPKAKVSEELLEALPDTYYAFNGALEEGVMIGFDMEKEGCPRALYTRNFKLVRELVKMGCVINGDKVDKAEASVKGTKTINGLKNIEEVAVGVVRLDFDSIVDGKKLYKLTVPQQPLRVGLNNPVLMTPLKAMYILASKLDVLFKNQLVRFTESTVRLPSGIKQGIVTSDKGVLQKVYAPNNVSKRVNVIECGYNYNTLRYFVYDLESSIYSKGYATFRPEMLDRLEVVTENDIDKSKHLIDFRLLKSVYDTKVKGIGLDEMLGIKFYDLSNFATVGDKVEALLSYGEELGGSEMYTIMKQNPSIFGDIAYELSQAELRQPRVLKELKEVKVPNSVEEFKSLVQNGLAKVTTLTKKGKVLEVYVTNNKKILSELLGGDYIRKYESAKYRYKEFKKILENSKFTDIRDIEALAIEYGLDVGIVVNNVKAPFDGDVSNILSKVEEDLDVLTSKTKEKAPTMVTVRKVYAKDTKDLYVTLDVSQIKEMEYAPVI